MEKENPIKYKNLELIWLFTVDLIKPLKNLNNIANNISESSLCDGTLIYYTPENRVKGVSEIKIVCEENNKEKCNELLELFSSTDFLTLDEDYLESQGFIRAILKGLKIKFPFSNKFFNTEIILTITNLGIGVFSFWTYIDEPLDSRTIAKLQILPMEEIRNLSVELPLEVLEELAIIDTDYTSIYEKKKEKGKKSFTLKETNFEEIISFYWSIILNRIYDLKFKSQEEIMNKLRYESYCVFPMTIIYAADQIYADEFVQNYPRQLYQILSQMYDIDYDLIYADVLDELLTPNITERRDIAYLDSLGSVVLIFGSDIEKIIKKQMKFDNTIKSVDVELKKYIIEAFIIVEILQIQRQYFNLITRILTKPIDEMGPRQISTIRSYLSKALDMYHSNVTGNSLARKRMEHGKDIMEIDECFDMVNEKMDLLGEALNSFHDLRTSFFEIALGLILGIVPLFYIFSPFQDPILDAVYAIAITIGIIVAFSLFSRWYWQHLKRKEL